MQNLYKKSFPQRSERETHFDILRMSDYQFEQFQKTAHHFNPYNDYFYTDLQAPKSKLLPSSLESIATLDNRSTLVPLMAMEKGAHTNSKSDFHRGGGLYDTVVALFKVLWSLVGVEERFNHWFEFFKYQPQSTKITKFEKECARLVAETYMTPADHRFETVGRWIRIPEFDTEHFSAWVDEENRTVHIAVSGTRLTTNDMWADYALLVGRETGTLDELEQYFTRVTDMYKGYLFECSAHSLGCAKVIELLYHKIKPEISAVFLFNAPLSPLYDKDQVKFVVADNRFRFYLNTADPISNFYTTVIPADREHVTWGVPKTDPLKNHSIEQWV